MGNERETETQQDESFFDQSGRATTLLNPINYVIEEGDFAYVISKDMATAKIVEDFEISERESQSYLKESKRKQERTIDDTGSRKPSEDISSTENGNHEPPRYEFYSRREALNKCFRQFQEAKNVYTNLEKKIIAYKLWDNTLVGKMTGHIIVVCPEGQFFEFVKFMRPKTKKPICFFDKKQMSLDFEQLLGKYDALYHLQGDPQRFTDLYNAAVEDCYQFVVISPSDGDPETIDWDAVMIDRALAQFPVQIPRVLEIANPNNARFLNFKPIQSDKEVLRKLLPRFMNGEIFFSSYIDTLASQFYYNRDLSQVLTKLFCKFTVDEFSNAQMGNTTFFGKSLFENSSLSTIKISEEYIVKAGLATYGGLFDDLLSLNPPVIPLGLLLRSSQTAFGMRKGRSEDNYIDLTLAPTPMMCVNPLKTTPVNVGDKVLVLGNIKYSMPSRKISESDLEISSFSMDSDDEEEETTLQGLILQSFLKADKNLKVDHKLIEYLSLEDLLEAERVLIKNTFGSHFSNFVEKVKQDQSSLVKDINRYMQSEKKLEYVMERYDVTANATLSSQIREPLLMKKLEDLRRHEEKVFEDFIRYKHFRSLTNKMKNRIEAKALVSQQISIKDFLIKVFEVKNSLLKDEIEGLVSGLMREVQKE